MIIDTMNTRLRELEAIMKDNLEIADSASKLYQRNIKLSEDINTFTKSNYELSKQLVLLAKDSKKSSESMNSLTEQLAVLTWILVVLGVFQFGIFIYLEISKRKFVKNSINNANFRKRVVRVRNKRARAYQKQKIKV